MPFEIKSNGVKLVRSGRTGAYSRPTGLKLSMWAGLGKWGNGHAAAVRYDAFPAKRFYGDDGVGVPCSARFEGFITVDMPGEYEFYTQFFTQVRMRINNKVVYDNFKPANPLDPESGAVKIRLKAGEKYVFSADMSVPAARLGVETFVVYYKKEGQIRGKIAPFEWFSPF